VSVRFNSYKRNLFLWARHFNYKILPAVYYGPCARCGKKGQHRHHKAHDYIFACTLWQVYAKRYIEFHPDDIDFLCAKCHKNAHRIYDELIASFNSSLGLYKNRTNETTQKVCEIYKPLFLARYLKWRNWGKKK